MSALVTPHAAARFLLAAGVTAKVIYSGGADLDILPQHASKGKGLEFLLKEVSLNMTQLLASGLIVSTTQPEH